MSERNLCGRSHKHRYLRRLLSARQTIHSLTRMIPSYIRLMSYQLIRVRVDILKEML